MMLLIWVSRMSLMRLHDKSTCFHLASRQGARYGLRALLVAVYPANIHMALHPELFPDMTAAALYGRLPLQFVFAWLVWWAARPGSAPPGGRA